ncbi:MAG: amidohydrolase [Tannerella sp.]|jgi:5-methylthioadenosine/S-adenosylhomocysteine deaminase|nr:amidohydrolase [Tannerella sp.]
MRIKNALLNGQKVDIIIKDDIIEDVYPADDRSYELDRTLNANGMAVIPGLVNMHTHSPMTLFRGLADDIPLKQWLEENIWPAEKRLDEETVYHGARLAMLEMIQSGTTAFNDMYLWLDVIEKAAVEMGIRAYLSETCFDFFKPHVAEKCKQQIIKRFEQKPADSRINYLIGTHAIYTVSGDLLRWAADFAVRNNVFMHLHLAETQQEVADSVSNFGLTPVRYLHKLKVLNPKLIIAHVLYVDDEEIKMLADAGVSVVHNPASNMKLGSGAEFKFTEMKSVGIKIALGSDGCASSNNLDMVEVMKLAALLGKAWRKDPTVLTCNEILDAATVIPAEIFGIKTGVIAKGYKADLCLVNLQIPAFTPNINFVSNLVYAANGSCIDTVICDGKVLMKHRKVKNDEDIIAFVQKIKQNEN